MSNAIASINVAGQLIGTLGPVAIDLALKIKALMEQNNLGSVDVKAVGDATTAVDDAVMADVNKWLKDNGFETLS